MSLLGKHVARDRAMLFAVIQFGSTERSGMLSLEEKLQDEIEFWRWFITEREKKGTQPVPRKARDALAYAEQKLTAHRNEILSKKI